MKYAFWPGCVSKGACPELYDSMILTSAKLGIELDEMYDGNCTGAGVIKIEPRHSRIGKRRLLYKHGLLF